MFTEARIKLTLWYLLIIMAISFIFSLAIYRVQVNEAETVIEGLSNRIERGGFLRPGQSVVIDPEILEDAKRRIIRNLIFINSGVLILAGGAAYFLSGRTLKPIEDMVEDQKRFVADASHELRTPITTMKTELEVNLRDKDTPKTTKKLLESSLEEVNKLGYLSDKLLHLSRYEQKQVEFSEVSLKEVLEEAVGKVEKAAKQKLIKINSKLNNVVLKGDKNSLIEAVSTLVDNAVKYSPKDSQVNIDAKKVGARVIIRIEDFGVGIKASDIPYIFNRFYRADQSRSKEKVPGFGLGLSIAKIIIDNHEGKISVKSTPGKGTTFSITLPVVS